ncbi:MAG TPA: RpiB/LacA/LacB family sugar-phosphate isomerase, partial [Pirellulaceae bacterium]|nr:RpiB/LacA/LacB family sugar-phosphate isomerase [Pirellulaceae bacterium]
MRIAIGSDHRGVQLKASLVQALSASFQEVFDAGPHAEDAVDYPDIAAEVGRRVATGASDRGVLICGTGIGMSIAANKIPGVRAAVCPNET